MKKIAIIGSGGLGRELLGIIKSINKENKTWDFIGFYDDNLSKELINGYSIIGRVEDLNSITEELSIVIGVGNPIIKEKIYQKLKNSKINFPNIIHPSVITYDEETITLGRGIVIGANSVLTVNINVSDFVCINTASIIAHDTEIDCYSTVMPSVCISAGAKIGKRVYLGNGTKIDYAIRIEDDSVIKAGTILSN